MKSKISQNRPKSYFKKLQYDHWQNYTYLTRGVLYQVRYFQQHSVEWAHHHQVGVRTIGLTQH